MSENILLEDIKKPKRVLKKSGVSGYNRSMHKVGPFEETLVMQVYLAGENNKKYKVVPRSTEFWLYNSEESGTDREHEDGVSAPIQLDISSEHGAVANLVQMTLNKGEYLVVHAYWDRILLKVKCLAKKVSR